MKSRPHDEAMVENFRANPEYAAILLMDVRRNGDSAEVDIVLRQLAEAFGQDVRWSLAYARFKLPPI